MLTERPSNLIGDAVGRDVVALGWPDQAGERDRLNRAGVPRLWFVEPGVEPPISEDCLEDWLRLPADDTDVRARLVALARRAACHPAVPTLDPHGRCTHHGAVVFLSPVEQHLMEPLIAHFGTAVSETELIGSAWLDGGRDETLRVHLSRLRRRLGPIGLEIANIRGYGYLLRPQS